jgi:starch synthase (maltosyl-transferring)
MSPDNPYLPRIVSFPPQRAQSATPEQLARYVELGFDHALLASDRALGNGSHTGAGKGLRILLDFDAGAACSSHELQEQHPDWFEQVRDDDDLPDPRRLPVLKESSRVRLRQEPEVMQGLLAHLKQGLAARLERGAAGFRCLGLETLAPVVWRQLLDAVRNEVPEARFLAWTPGTSAHQIAELVGVGFDATFASLAWWDMRSGWMVAEAARLAAVAPPIAFPDSPDEAVLARTPGYDDPARRERICRRALRLAAACGNGLLVTAGFEYGASGAGFQGGVGDQGAAAAFDLSDELREANAFIAHHGARFHGAALRQLSAGESGATVLLRRGTQNTSQMVEEGLLVLVNPDVGAERTASERRMLEHADGLVRAESCWPVAEEPGLQAPVDGLLLAPGEVKAFLARRPPPIVVPTARSKASIGAAVRAPRIAIESVTPSVDFGRFPVKRTVGEVVDVEADVFMDGHDKLAVALLWRSADERDWREVRMHALGNDRWRAALPLMRLGRTVFAIEAWRDAFATFRDELEKKSSAGLNVGLELEEGRLLVEAAAAHAQESGIEAAAGLKALAKSLKLSARDKARAGARDAERIAALLSQPTADAMHAADARPFAVRSDSLRVDAERHAASFSSWYELFPRSQSGDVHRHGTFDDVIRRLPAIQAMGFDTLYFTPIHPIGKKHRKGRNNSLVANPDDPGSPYAIGSEEGGHDAIHPELGTIADFRRLREEAASHGLEIALDFAIQCAPDHPWLRDHPEWFAWRPDGSLRYAENPPKKYQDIVNVDFYADGAIPGLWLALRDVVLFWVKEGVRAFRVDNPHTKPLPFWEWMIADVKSRHPDTIFLSEAFTRPKVMYRLAKVGFSQSYTYFTWRHSKQEFTDYLTELSTTSVRDYFRPHFFVNTPDINPPFLQKSGRPGYLIRAALATTLSGLWGMYSGFELCEGTPVPGKEEYLDSEKYEIRAWDWQRPGNIIDEITHLNRIRRENPALQSHLGVHFLPCSSEHILFFLKTTRPLEPEQTVGDSAVLVAIVLDPAHAHEGRIELPFRELGLSDGGTLDAVDLLTGARIAWHGRFQQLRLDPFVNPYAIWRVRHQGE